MSDVTPQVKDRAIPSIDEQALRRIQQARKNLEYYESPGSNPRGLVGYAASISELVKALVDAGLGQRLDELPESSDDGRAEAIRIYRRFRRGEKLKTVVGRLRELERDAPRLVASVDPWIRKDLMKEILGEKPEPIRPLGWEGSYAESVDTLADFVAWLNQMIRRVELLTGPGGWTQPSNLLVLRNAHRLIDKLGLMGMPSLPAEALTCHGELAHLRRLRHNCVRRLKGQGEGNGVTVTQAAEVSAVNKGTIWRAARNGELKNNGLTGRALRIDAADLFRWTSARVRKPEPAESEAAVKRKVKQNVDEYRA